MRACDAARPWSTVATDAAALTVAVDHPVVQAKLALLRSRATDVPTFRRVASELALLVLYEATRSLAAEPIEVETPLERTSGVRLSGERIAIVPVLRAGLGMLDGALQLIPDAAVGFVGVYRQEDELRPVPYFLKLPLDFRGREVLLLDPMVATGGSAAYAVAACKDAGAARITLVSLLAAPEGLERLHREHPDVPVYCAAIDRVLNERGFILPGLGDAGDRQFGTL
jgi:uracil phosphoribosyltransferase